MTSSFSGDYGDVSRRDASIEERDSLHFDVVLAQELHSVTHDQTLQDRLQCGLQALKEAMAG